jgi:hypothetical protein
MKSLLVRLAVAALAGGLVVWFATTDARSEKRSPDEPEPYALTDRTAPFLRGPIAVPDDRRSVNPPVFRAAIAPISVP